MADICGSVDAVQDHVRHGQHVRKSFFLDAANGFNQRLFVFLGFDVVLPLVVDGTGEKAAGAAGGVKHDFVQLRIDPIYDKPGEGARSVELARVPGALQVAEDLFVNAAERVAVARVVEVDFGDLVNDLAHQRTRLHVIVGVFEHVAYDACPFSCRAVADHLFLQGGKELVVDEVRQGLAGDALWILRPGAPAQVLRQRGFVVVFDEFQLSLAVIENLEEKHPYQLADALSIAIDTDILAHDVLNGFDNAGNITHAISSCLNSSCSNSCTAESNLSLPPKMLLMISTGVPMALKGSRRKTLAFSRVPMPSSAYLSSRAVSTARACSPHLVK